MYRSLAIAVSLIVLFVLVMTACQPIQPPMERQGEMGNVGEAVDKCLEIIPNQAIVTMPTRSVEDVDAFFDQPVFDEAMQRVDVVDRFIIQPPFDSDETPPLAVVLLEGDGLDKVKGIIDSDTITLTYGDNLTTSFIDGATRFIEGGGHSPSQVPFGKISKIPEGVATLGGFINQWALNYIVNTTLYTSYDSTKGEGVRIAVFDTSPFAPEFIPFDKDVTVIPGDKASDPLHPMTTHVFYSDIRGPARDHGVFVASLAHAIAPYANIFLYRALNEDGIGNVFTLVEQMNDFYQYVHPEPVASDGILRSVVNLSLTVSCNEDDYEKGAEEFAKSILALNTIITSMHESGIVIVAAAGNEGKVTENSTEERPIQAFPASHSMVIGVGASNRADRTPTCYSNKADIFAPGGNASPNDCEPLYVTCPVTDSAAIGQCDGGLVGLSTASESGLAYWAGTSFATPLVSGLIAHWIDDATIGSDIVQSVSGRDVINVTKLQGMLYRVEPEALVETDYGRPESTTMTNSLPYTYYVLQ